MPDKSRTYALFNKGKKVYIGESEDPLKRAEQHADEGKKFDRVETTSRTMKIENAQNHQADQLQTYRRGHGGKNPKYNKTDEG